MVTANDEFLLGYEVNPDTGDVLSYEPKPINIPPQFGKPKQTANIDLGANLPANGDLKDPALFDITDLRLITVRPHRPFTTLWGNLIS